MNHLGGHGDITHIDEGALKFLKNTFHINTMLDIGCGPGGMLAVANKLGIQYTGIDGDPDLNLKYPPFITHDFTNKFEKYIKADLAWSVEFLEHVEEEHIDNYMKVFQSTEIVFCTAAPPGKKGYHHVNCQPINYWIDKFSDYGFTFNKNHSNNIRKASTMIKNFVRTTGMIFTNEN